MRRRGDSVFDDHEPVGFDLLTVPWTRPNDVQIKLLLSLAWAGELGLGDYVASRYDLALRFHEALSGEPGVSCPYVPESNIVCFRVGQGDQLALLDRLMANGQLHFGSTTIAGERYLRVVVTAPDTDEATLAELIQVLREAAVASGVATRRPKSATNG